MLPHKLLTTLLTTILTLVPTGGLLPHADPPVDVHEELSVEVLGTNVTLTLDSDPAIHPVAPGAPRGLAAEWDGRHVALAWDAPEDEGAHPVHTYRVYRREGAGEFAPVAQTPQTSTTDVAVSPRHGYDYAVSAVSAAGEGPRSDVVALGPALAPVAPRDLEARVYAGGVVGLTWTHKDPTSVVEYVVYVAAPGGPKHELGRTTTPGFNDTIAIGETKVYHVTAVNAAGESDPSPEASAHRAVPLTAPRDLSANARVGAVDLAWTIPESPGEGALSYRVYRASGTSGNWTRLNATNATSYTDTGVNATATYRYRVTAVDANGESAPSNEASATVPAPPPVPPGAPRTLNATGAWHAIRLNWTAPTSGGAPQGYRIYAKDGDAWALVAQTNASARSYEHAPLASGETRTYHVRAFNAAGEGDASNEATARALGAPGAPTGPSAEGGLREVRLSWTKPANDGGATITGYRIYRANGTGGAGANWSLAATTNATSYTDTVAPGTYSYAVSAVAAAEGPRSDVAAATAYGAASPPTNVTTSRGVHSIHLAWRAPADDGGRPILGYRVYELVPATNATRNATILRATLGADARSWVHTGLADGESRTYVLAAFTDAGEGARSAPVAGRAQSAPGAPEDVAAQRNVPSTAIRVSWSNPEDDGGSRITAYRVYRSMGGGAFVLLAELGGGARSLWDESCGAATLCSYAVSAVNARGEGARSDVATTI